MNSAKTPLAGHFSGFDHQQAGTLIAETIAAAYQRVNVKPLTQIEIAPLPQQGNGFDGFRKLLADYSAASCALASPAMIGHMDTAPHPLAAYADAVVSALNNNLLFRELSPAASRVEEHMLSELANRMQLRSDWHGTFTSGGSLANLSALFAATGGFGGVAERGRVSFFVPECTHTSVLKSAAVLGVPPGRIHVSEGDDQGRADPVALADRLRQFRQQKPDGIAIVVAVLGSTIHGAIEPIDQLADVCEEYGAWLHVDAIYGAALAFSSNHCHCLEHLDRANSVVAAPQKWMFVPRVSAMLWVKGKATFDESLAFSNNYSTNKQTHRGTWGLQGSRRADAVTLWAVLNYTGTDALGEEVDVAIARTGLFHNLLQDHRSLQPTHSPDLNLQCFNYREAGRQADVDSATYRKLGRDEYPWVSISRWRDTDMFRAVLLSPAIGESEAGGVPAVLERLLAELS